MIKIAVVIGSTRPNRFADVPARWTVERANARTDFEIEVLDLRDHPLPFFEEFSNPAAEAWRHKIGGYDGFVILAAEYNHGPTAVLKNALDYGAIEWQNKPVGFVGYGGVGGARAVEQLRLNAIELQMAPIRNAVHIAMEPFVATREGKRTLESYDYLNQGLDALFDQLVWWAKALKAARAQLANAG
jgi:NAD(P)H-dependent FMN reductase